MINYNSSDVIFYSIWTWVLGAAVTRIRESFNQYKSNVNLCSRGFRWLKHEKIISFFILSIQWFSWWHVCSNNWALWPNWKRKKDNNFALKHYKEVFQCKILTLKLFCQYRNRRTPPLIILRNTGNFCCQNNRNFCHVGKSICIDQKASYFDYNAKIGREDTCKIETESCSGYIT